LNAAGAHQIECVVGVAIEGGLKPSAGAGGGELNPNPYDPGEATAAVHEVGRPSGLRPVGFVVDAPLGRGA